MALIVALPLSGLETETFSSFSSFGLRDILGLSQTSPSPSTSSDSSSIGSLGSLKSESINNASVPASPQATEKKTPTVPTPEPEVKVMHGGRNILDLGRNMDPKGWNFNYAYLPSNNTSVFFANRSQYHRLGGYHIDHPTDKCKHCDFTSVVE